MPKLSISQIAAFSGMDRRTVTARVEHLDFTEGEDNAHLFDSADALRAIYCPGGQTKSLDQARAELAIEQKELTRIRKEEAQRERIPLPIVMGVWDAAMQSAAAILKAAKGKILDPAKINEILAKLQEGAEIPLKW